MKGTAVDVLIPVFNRAGMLGQAVDSVLDQTFTNLRVVIYDDGSTDGCMDEVRADPRVVVMRGEENHGAGYARARLLEAVTSPYACWQDSDDVSHPHRLEKQFAYLETHPLVDMVLTYMFFFQHPSHHTCTRTIHKVDSTRFKQHKGFWNNLTFATGMFRRKLQEYPFDETRNLGGEDVEWMHRLLEAGTTFGHIEYPAYYCRRHDGRMTYQRKT